MKKIILVLLMSVHISSCSSQSIKYGVYRSKDGSFLKIKADGTFDYSREFHLLKLDNPIHKPLERSKGIYQIKDNFLVLNTNNNYIDSILDKSIRVKELESINKRKDSITIKIKKNNFFKVYICHTGIEVKKDIEDISNSFLLANNEVYVKNFYTDYYSIKIYPNLDNSEIRGSFSDIKRICFESKKFERKDSSKDIYIDVDFDILNFYIVELKDEIVLFNKDELFFNGEIFYLNK